MRNNKRKIPGMIYIFISFIPWIVYWILCGMGNALGIVFSFAISLILIIPQIRKRDFNLMDLTAILYFGIATAGTFVFDSNIFVKNNGFIGYFVLFLMALFSIIIKQPYTLQVSRKDYPEIYWKEESFLVINNVITGFWAIIFIVNAFIFLLLGMPFTVILSNILIGLGIAFSIIFPLKAVAYFATKEFKRYDWRMEVNSQRPKKEDEYDVIIVGSGIGGLACGALLSKRGYKVLVLEQHYQVGGYGSSFKRGDFIFNSSVIDVSGLWEKGPITYLLKQLGFKKENFFVKNTTKYILKAKEIIIPDNLNDSIKKLSELFPNESENIKRFFEDVKKAYEECYQECEVFGAPLPPNLFIKAFGKKKLLDYPKDHPYFYNWLDKTFKEKLDEFFTNKDLKAFLGGMSAYTGTLPEKTSAIMALTVWMGYFIHGGHFTKGGVQNFADALSNFIKAHGGNVLTNHKVDKIIVKDNLVEGIKVKDLIFKAPIVVVNANAKTVFLELVGGENLDKKFLEYIKGLKMSFSCFVVYLGVNMDLSNYPTLIKNLDESFEIAIISNSDKNLAPNGKSSILILGEANYCDFPERGTEEYLQKKKEFAEMLIQKAEKVIPNLKEHIIIQDTATPKTFERYTSMPEGALYSFDQSIDVKRPYFKTLIKGLYLAGASTFPGGGIEGVVISGIICTNDICNWDIKAL
ncbi:FAD-dependent oxidoreductase [Patescibacteria group bacterium]|nr:FAD-dependent oxidoreductase [Patescibacteria group bacterium]MBU1349626.1 FAD-dependent oxidoreductase [Patescibacteria group bacterium]MBU1421345.1 FAD-dependent oxidoreductase [Patescibacteria group bacterium]MBU2415890.1 FAD-dependent oxidoreductase [Patescibacteria group bacterium]MBU2456534.1 FAD-dependent oxidoreductase [Patescibacteria group bacterium]